MFKFMHGGIAWKVEFRHLRHNPPETLPGPLGKDFSFHGSTSCDIWRQEQEVDEANIVSSRLAWCVVGDRWQKSIGREIALDRALRNHKLVKVDNPPPEVITISHRWEPLFTRDFRRLVWACYWVMSNRAERIPESELLGAVACLMAAGTKIPDIKPKEQNVQG
jgi:hypothetical protein